MQADISNLPVTLEAELEALLQKDTKVLERERAAKRVKLTMEGIARKLGLPHEVKMFGSFSNGFKTGTSDLDIVFAGEIKATQEVHYLGKFAEQLSQCGFSNITKIFQASTKLVKFTDVRTQMEVDFCISNELGVRNSIMLGCYCEFDQRVPKVGRLIKDWAKRHDLVGSADGYMNSYAYMLLTIFYLQQTSPPVLPNLQAMATDPVHVHSSKWGMEDTWDTKFCDDIEGLEKSKNEMSVGQLLAGFFHYYAFAFDWKAHAVCMRKSQPGQCVDKFTLQTRVTEEQWYVEDPFDLKHNLAGRCSRTGCQRILGLMRDTFAVLSRSGRWDLARPAVEPSKYFLKCRIGPGVTPQAFLEEFEELELVKLHFPKPSDPGTRNLQAFLEFETSAARRCAHTKNECILPGCPQQLHLHVSSEHALNEAIQALEASGGSYSTFEMSAYKLKRAAQMERLGLGGAETWPGMEQQDGHQMPVSMMPPAMALQAGMLLPPGQLGWQMPPGMLHPGAVPLTPALSVPGGASHSASLDGAVAVAGIPRKAPASPGAEAAQAAAPHARAEAAKAKSLQSSAPKLLNRAVARSLGLASAQERDCWISLEVSLGASEHGLRTPCPALQENLESLRAFCRQHQSSARSSAPTRSEVEVRVALADESQQRPLLLSEDSVSKLHEFQRWARRGPAEAG